MKLRRHARVWRWFAVTIFVGFLVWRLGPASFAGRHATSKPQVAAADFGQWSFIGPPNYLNTAYAGSIWTGRVTSVAVDPADANHWLIGAAQGGVWDSHDAGATWQPRTDGQPSLAIGAIAFSPTSPNVVYAGTGEARFSGWTYAGAGMLRSDDSGATWSVVNTTTFARASVRAILVHPADPNIVVAGTARGAAGRDLDFVRSAPIYGVQRSTDGGRTWTLLLRGEVSDLVRHPADFSRQYAAIGAPNVPGGAVPGPMPNGLYRTADTGDHWTPVAGPWTALAGGSGLHCAGGGAVQPRGDVRQRPVAVLPGSAIPARSLSDERRLGGHAGVDFKYRLTPSSRAIPSLGGANQMNVRTPTSFRLTRRIPRPSLRAVGTCGGAPAARPVQRGLKSHTRSPCSGTRKMSIPIIKPLRGSGIG